MVAFEGDDEEEVSEKYIGHLVESSSDEGELPSNLLCRMSPKRVG
jgi:hypothetical protein